MMKVRTIQRSSLCFRFFTIPFLLLLVIALALDGLIAYAELPIGSVPSREKSLSVPAVVAKVCPSVVTILTRGVPLGHLVAREFRVGEAVLRGVQICEPCEHVVGVTGIKGLLPNLIHRGGLHAQIVTSGLIRVGDPVVPIA